MRIGIDARLWNETGVGRYIRSIFEYLPQVDDKNEYIWFFRQKEFNEIKFPLPHWKKTLADIRWHSLKEQLLLPKIFTKEQLDLLHFPYFSFPIFYKGKFVITIHDLIFDHYKSGRASTLPYPIYLIKKIGYHFILQKAIDKASKIITISENSKHEIINHYHADPGKIVVTYESGSLEIPENATSNNSKIKKQKPYILYVGNAHPHKNVESLINSMSLIRKRLPKLKLIIIGSDNFFFPKLANYIKVQKMQNAAILIGEVPNQKLSLWYQNAECFVSASYMEGFGIPILESMSVGCPTVLSDIPIFHEIAGPAAAYFDPESPQSIANKIVEVVKNLNTRKNLQQKGYERLKLFSWRKMVEETVSIYKDVGNK